MWHGAERAFVEISLVRAEAIGATRFFCTGAGVLGATVAAKTASTAKAAVAVGVKAPAPGALGDRGHAVHRPGWGRGAEEAELPGRFFREVDNGGLFKAAVKGVARPGGSQDLLFCSHPSFLS